MRNSRWVSTNLKCPKCPSSDGYALDIEDHGYCFVCGFNYFPKDKNPKDRLEELREELTPLEMELLIGGTHRSLNLKDHPLADRAITRETCEFFDVKVLPESSTDPVGQIIFPYTDKDGNLVAQKVRSRSYGKGLWRGNKQTSTLFGASKFSAGKTITITEGEMDVLAFRDLQGDYPVVSISDGAVGAANCVRKNLEYFKNFSNVYICFDSDEPGRKAAQEVAQLFPIGKAKIVHLRHHKDANDYLKAKDFDAFRKCWWAAEAYTPAGIEEASKGGFDSLFEEIDDLELFPWPFEELNAKTLGLRKREIVTVIAGSGVGKSEFLGEAQYKLLMETDKKIGILNLEESPNKTKLRFMSKYLNRPLHITLLGKLAKKFPFLDKVLHKLFSDDSVWDFNDQSKKDLKAAWDHTVEKKTSKGEHQLWLFRHFGSNDIDTIVSRIDSMVTGLGCEFVFLDHVSIVVSDQQSGDERKALDELATKLRTLVEHRNFSLVIVSHLRRPGGKPHEEGGETSLADIRGTAGIGQLSDIVIGLERNGQHQDDYLKNITKIRVLKNRFAGFLGLSSYVYYDKETGRLTEVDAQEVIDREEGVAVLAKEDPFNPHTKDDSALSLGLPKVDLKVV